jgi:hypothetical protein
VHKPTILILFLSALLILSESVSGQSFDDSLDLKRIHSRAVKLLIKKDKVKSANDFQQIATSCYSPDDSLRYETNLKTYIVKARVANVWDQYMNISPRNAWSGKKVNFGFLFSKPANKFIYAENADDPIREGSVVFVNLKLLRGLKNLGVGFEITRLDEDNKTICFCYLKDGVSNGTQEIQFTEMPNGDTQISHLTHYRSRSVFRDKELYPRFHEKFVGEFHQNVLRQIETEQ